MMLLAQCPMPCFEIRKMLKVSWADSIRRTAMPRCKAEEAYREIERIRGDRGGRMTADAFWRAAKVRTSPCHKMFDWNVRRAAVKHWQDTARLILRSVVVERVGGKSHHAYFQIQEKRVRFYAPAHEIMSNKDHAVQLLKQAESYYLSGRDRYDEVIELARIHRVIDATFKRSRKRA